jgi:hypothetical protein
LFGFLNSLNAACPPIGTHWSTTLPQTALIFSKNSASTSNLIYFINTSALFRLSTYVQKWSNTLQDPYNETNDNGNGTLSYVGGKNSLQFPPVIRGYRC